MKKPILILALAFAFGIYYGNIFKSYTAILFIEAVFIIFIAIIFFKNKKILFISFGVLLFFFIGAFQFTYNYKSNYYKFEGYVGQEAMITGHVASEPDIKESKIVYTIKTDAILINGVSKRVTGRVLLSTLKENYQYEYGREVKITGQLNLPKGKRNPGGFDYRNYLAGSGISATIFAIQGSIKMGEIRAPNFLVGLGMSIRNNMVEVINKSLPEEQAGLFMLMVC